MIWWESVEKTEDGFEVNLTATSKVQNNVFVDVEIVVVSGESSKVLWSKTIPYTQEPTQEDLSYSFGSKLQRARKTIAQRTLEKLLNVV